MRSGVEVGANGPLVGLRVIELGQLVAGPYCGQLFGDFGADVIKVEAPGTGDPMRSWGQVKFEGQSLWWPIIARNKRSVTVDLRTADGQRVVRDLVAQADVLVENFRPGTMERWGLSFEALSAANPRLIMVRISGYGQTGPYAKRPGYASVGEAMGGLRHVIGYPDRPSCRAGVSLGDTVTGLMAFSGALAALHARASSGLGQVVDATIYESVLSLMESLVPEFAHAGYVRHRTGAVLPGIAPTNAYPAADGEILIAANQDTIFRRLCLAMGSPSLAEDPRFSTHDARGDHQFELDAIIACWTQERSCQAIGEILEAADVPNGKAYTPEDMLADPHFQQREAIVRVQGGPAGETLMQNAFPILSATPGSIKTCGPALGAHTEEVLLGLPGYTPSRLRELKAEGVI